MIREAVEELGSPTTNRAVRDWVAEHYPEANPLTVQTQLLILCVNQPSRTHYPENQRARPCTDVRYDYLYRPDRGEVEWYRPEQHGAWSIEQDDEGNFAISCDDGELIWP
ncbi:MAG: hypothetical protein AB7Y46_09245 [Armatimonadota bacterium]